MSAVAATSKPAIGGGFRLQWEPAQKAHVLLYPEGMVQLNQSAGEIMRRCDGARTLAEIVADLEQSFARSGLTDDVIAFVKMAMERGWLQVPE
ncbi:MAG: pyrroloquinoline quinone biosynthesis protein PqqD [Candidatus Muproteobacteria bacterium RBG_16_60_9]|uniref:PqqA binding protein n=1 Tax=Candidatus Muproteobacteria bacterium RBG_16_60_9 TaxID=1817755 RepID=A0A1F6VAM9_9PROT|nr:MAG: pyrroloquinoline quinone biosynthesis protein PqqD [Candidatus Muproteobacteria bacterium RBG_16_60_9]